MKKFSAVLLASAVATTSACSSMQEFGRNMGIATGLVGGYLLGDNDTDRLLYGVALATALGYVGNEIGKGLDQEEKRRMAASTVAVLDTEVPAGASVRTTGVVSASAPAPADAPSAGWQSGTKPDTVSGKSTLLQVAGTSKGECRTVRQLVTVNGSETSQDVKYCREGAGAWEVQA